MLGAVSTCMDGIAGNRLGDVETGDGRTVGVDELVERGDRGAGGHQGVAANPLGSSVDAFMPSEVAVFGGCVGGAVDEAHRDDDLVTGHNVGAAGVRIEQLRLPFPRPLYSVPARMPFCSVKPRTPLPSRQVSRVAR
ncbi:MAG TPA: hypothetical protein VNP92_21665 [Actinophytocola sp.]|nr:hypothetical protein [Actinophytocola sp.]